MSETITTLKIEDVYPNPRHYREVTAAATKTLAASISVIGQIEPITVFKDGDIHIIDSGHHRHAAMKSLGLKTIEAIVLNDIDETKSSTLMVASNMHFPETTIEKSRGAQMMLSTGVRPVDVAAVIGDDKARMSQVAKGVKIAKDYAEDMSLDRLIALAEFDGDEDACKSIMTTNEASWLNLVTDLRRVRKVNAEAARCEEIIKASGVTLIKQTSMDKHEYMTRGDTMPEGAKFATVSRGYNWAEIVWHKSPGKGKADKKAAAEREAREKLEAEMQEASARRLAFVYDHLKNTSLIPISEVRNFAEKLWEDGRSAGVNSIDEVLAPLTKFRTRIYAALLSQVNAQVEYALVSNGSYYVERYGDATLDYYAALQSAGYEMSPVETERIAWLKAEIDPPCPECGGDGRIADKTGGGRHGKCPACKGTGKEAVDAE